MISLVVVGRTGGFGSLYVGRFGSFWVVLGRSMF